MANYGNGELINLQNYSVCEIHCKLVDALFLQWLIWIATL